MITLYGFGPLGDLPDPSPFVMKAQVLLKMAKLPFEVDTTGFRKAPKGKLPYIDDAGERIADSTFIRWHLEKKYRIDLDQTLAVEQRATAWAFEKMAEDNCYWANVYWRWMDDANFAKGPAMFFRTIPALIRPIVIAMVRRKVRNALYAEGMGRHSPEDITALGVRSIEAMTDYLASKPFFMGNEPTGID